MELGTCPNQVDGIGNGGCLQPPLLKTIRAIHPAKISQSFATLADFQDEDKWKEEIFNQNIFPLIPYEESEDASTEATEVTSSAGNIFLQEDGKYGVQFMMAMTPDQNRILLSYNNKKFKFYMVDNFGTIAGTTPDGNAVTGYSGSMTVKKRQMPFTTDTVEYSVVRVMFDDHFEFNKTPRYAIGPELDWNPLSIIQPMTKITLTPSTVASNAFTCAFAYVDPTTGKSVPMPNVSTSDIVVLDQNGDTVTVTVVATSTEGTYTITDTGATMTSGSITAIGNADSLYYSDTVTLSAA
jgi:hypothetical protein